MPDGRFKCVASLPFSFVVPSCIMNLSSFGESLTMRCASRSMTYTFPSQSTPPECCHDGLMVFPLIS